MVDNKMDEGPMQLVRRNAISISPVKVEDAHLLTRKVEYPAHLDGPLYRLMFPQSYELHMSEDEIQWTINGMLEGIQREDEFLYQAYGEDGLPVGLIGWTTNPGRVAEGSISGTCVKSSTVGDVAEDRGDTWCPRSLDVVTWLTISKQLREERQRVLQRYQIQGVSRITSMAVDPDYQQQGVGSLLLEMFCRAIDDDQLDAFVLSSPAGVRLYTKFGFKTVSVVETKCGNFTSMLRTSSKPKV